MTYEGKNTEGFVERIRYESTVQKLEDKNKANCCPDKGAGRDKKNNGDDGNPKRGVEGDDR